MGRLYREIIPEAKRNATKADKLFSQGRTAEATKQWNEASSSLDKVDNSGPNVPTPLMAASRDENPRIRRVRE